jgi:RHS repeat-associated protein
MGAIAATSALAIGTILYAGPASAATSDSDAPATSDTDWTELGAWEGATAPDAIAAAAFAKITGEAVEDLSQRTESSQTFALPDGQWRTDMSTGPEWVATGADPSTEEGWVPLDTTLAKHGDGTYRTKAHPGDVIFSGGGEGRTMVAMGTNADGNPFELWWTGTLPEPVVDGDAVRYVDVQPGVDLVFFVTATGYEQFFVAKTSAALKRAKTLSLEYKSPEDSLRTSGDGFAVTGEDGEIVAYTGAVEVWDAIEDRARLNPVATMAVAKAEGDDADADTDAAARDADSDRNPSIPPATTVIDAKRSVKGSKGTVTIDTSDVPVDADTVFPVVIDPSVNLTLSFDTFVSNIYTSDKSSSVELFIGTHNSGSSKYRSFFNVDVSPILGKKVSKATFSLYNHHSWSCTAKGWEVWSTSTTNTSTRWSNMPALNYKYASPTATKGYSSSCADSYVSADITTLVHNWSVQSPTKRGMAVKAASETDNFGWKRFYSGNSSSNKPKLSVTYNSYPNTPSSIKANGVTPASGTMLFTNDTTPTFSAVVKDPDGGNVRGRFTVKTGSTTVATKTSGSNVASGSTSSYTTPTLTQGKAYDVEVWAYDGALESKSSIKPTWTVFVDTIAPGTTSITSPQFTNGEWKDTAPTSVSATFSATHAVKFEYKIDGGATKTVTTTTSSATVTGLPRTKGGHKVVARAVDRANNTSAWQTFEYGIGSVGINAPAPGYKTVDKVPVVASAPPGTNGPVARTVQWRPNGSSEPWQELAALGQVASGVDPSVNYVWSAAQTAVSADKARVPFAMDVQVCFTYTYTNDTLCTWGSDASSKTTVVHIPHAFGDNFPVASAGPGQVAMWTGEFNTSISDLEVPGYTGTLSLSRSYNTFGGGTEDSVFGPGWNASFDGADVGVAGLLVLDSTGDDGMIALEDEDGSYLLYTQANGGAVAQGVGEYVALDDDTASLDYTLTVHQEGGQKFLDLLDDDGVITRWIHVGGGEWVQHSVIEPANAGTTTFSRDADNRITRILAPVPHGLEASACTDATFAPGCRALYIDYYGSAGSGTDGAYTGRVSKVRYRAWDPDAGAMGYQDIATYEYTAAGLLETVTDERNGVSIGYAYESSTVAPVPLLTKVRPGGLAAWNMEYNASTAELTRVTRDAPVTGGDAVPMSRYVYRMNTATPVAGTPDIRAAVAAWGQTRVPTVGFAVFGPGEDPGTTISESEWKYAQLSYTDDLGYTLNSAEFGAGQWLFTADEFDENDNIVRSLDTAAAAHLIELSVNNDGEPAAESEINAVASITRYNDTIVAAAEIIAGDLTIPAGTVLVPAGTLVTDEWDPASADGSAGLARIHTRYIYDEGAPNSGINPLTGTLFSLATTVVETKASADSGTWDLDVPVATGEPVLSVSRSGYDPIDGADVLGPTSGWMLGAETVSTLEMGAGNSDIVTKSRYDVLARPVESRGPGSNGADASTQFAYFYTVADNPEAPECGGVQYAKWAGLPCLTCTAETTPTVPSVHTSAYSMLLAPATITEQLGSVVRESTTTFLPDGRTDSTSLTVTGLPDSVPVATTKVEYEASTGLPVATVAYDGATETGRVSTTSDLWGRNLTYTDADGQTTTNTYDSKGRLLSVADPQQTVTYGYDGVDAAGLEERRSLGTTMTINGIGTFTAAYDNAGNVTVQEMPGGITQTSTYTLTGEPVGLSYSALDPEGELVPLIAWEQESDLYGRVIAESTPTAGQAPGTVSEFNRAYEYDNAGRLVKVEDRTASLGESVELPDGTGDITPCVTRTYDFDERGNRLARSTATSGTDGLCTTADAFTEAWSYDDADRVQTGANTTGTYQYDALGRQLVLPAIDTPFGPASGNLEIGYYDSDLVASLAQDGTTTSFELDPLERRSVSTAVSGGVTQSVVRHYSDATDNPAWVVATDPDGVAKTTWYGTGLADDLGVTVTDGVTQVQLADLHGDIAIPVTLDGDGLVVAVGGFADFDEYGRPLAGTATPDTGGVSYGWLGGQERATDEATGLMLMGVRLYNPNTGLFTSVDPVPGGNTTAYTYPQDPINKFDLDGKAWGWAKKLKKAAKAVAKVAEIASFIPGPIGMAAAGIQTAALLARGDYKAAAAAAVGLVPGGKLIATVAKGAAKVAKAAKAGKKAKEFKSNVKLGNKAHKKFDRHVVKRLGGTKSTKYLNCGGKRCKPDGYTSKGAPIELKPHNKAAIARGKTQLAKYSAATGKQGQLWTYRKTWYGRIKFSRYS